ncbi:MAG: hypothetical protein Crog4KO_24140 [Crocinitomicaceae bacterium]
MMRFLLVSFVLIAIAIGCEDRSSALPNEVKSSLKENNNMENYKPDHPIEFPHAVHAALDGIDCKHCHNAVRDSKAAGLPTVKVCMSCHSQNNYGRVIKEKKHSNDSVFDETHKTLVTDKDISGSKDCSKCHY